MESQRDILWRDFYHEVEEREVREDLEPAVLNLAVWNCQHLRHSEPREGVEGLLHIANIVVIRYFGVDFFQPRGLIQQKLNKLPFPNFSDYLQEEHKLISHSESHRLIQIVIPLNEDICSCKFFVVMVGTEISEDNLHHQFLLRLFELWLHQHFDQNLD